MDISELFINPYFWLKIMVLLITIGYSVFAFVIINQIRAMDKIIHLPPTKTVLLISVFNLIFGVSLFIISLAII